MYMYICMYTYMVYMYNKHTYIYIYMFFLSLSSIRKFWQSTLDPSAVSSDLRSRSTEETFEGGLRRRRRCGLSAPGDGPGRPGTARKKWPSESSRHWKTKGEKETWECDAIGMVFVKIHGDPEKNIELECWAELWEMLRRHSSTPFCGEA